MALTEKFREDVRAAWGNPRQVANAGMDELFRHADSGINLDGDDQVRYAQDIGILAGETKNQVADVFIEGFERMLAEIKGEE